jgi:hypothetical protein
MSHFSSEPGRVGPEMPGRHAPALIFFRDIIFLTLNSN